MLVINPPSCIPRKSIPAFCVTNKGSEPKERNPITGFFALVLMSTAGEKLRCTPSRR